MWTLIIGREELESSKRWTPSYFKESHHNLDSAFPLISLRDLVTERRSTIDPQALGETRISYLGLENVRPLTGELVGDVERPANSIKSRSKTFEADDVLYGRLRPELNKVFLAQGQLSKGVCSGEFIVLKPNQAAILPRYLRHILTSLFVTSVTARLRAGASLPRISTDDLLGIEIPVPSLEDQAELVSSLESIDQEILEMRSRLETLPEKTAQALLAAISSGSGSLQIT